MGRVLVGRNPVEVGKAEAEVRRLLEELSRVHEHYPQQKSSSPPCSFCLESEVTEDNDILLCDGEGCYRAYHYSCLNPAVTKNELDALEEWFCYR